MKLVGTTIFGVSVWAPIDGMPGKALVWDGPGARVELERHREGVLMGDRRGLPGELGERRPSSLEAAQAVVDEFEQSRKVAQ